MNIKNVTNQQRIKRLQLAIIELQEMKEKETEALNINAITERLQNLNKQLIETKEEYEKEKIKEKDFKNVLIELNEKHTKKEFDAQTISMCMEIITKIFKDNIKIKLEITELDTEQLTTIKTLLEILNNKEEQEKK